MKYKVFATEQEALIAQSIVSTALGLPTSSVNAATNEIESNVLTSNWAQVQQITDGRWVFVSPDNTGEESEKSWWPPVLQYNV